MSTNLDVVSVKIKAQANEIYNIVSNGQLSNEDVDRLVEYGVDKEAVYYYKKYLAKISMSKQIEICPVDGGEPVLIERKPPSIGIRWMLTKSKFRKLFRFFYSLNPIKFIRRQFLKLALGSYYNYMVESITQDQRTKTARMVDIVVRKDGMERRIEADWVKEIARII